MDQRKIRDLQEAERVCMEMGVDLATPAVGLKAAMASGNREIAQKVLDDFKAKVNKVWRKVALELHPDRTGNDPEKTEKFKRYAQAMETIKALDLPSIPPPRPNIATGIRLNMGPIVIIVGPGGNFSVNTRTTTATTGFANGVWSSDRQVPK